MAMSSKAIEALGFADGAHQGDRALRALMAWLYAAGASDPAMHHLGACYLSAVQETWPQEQRHRLALALRGLAVDALGVQAPRARLGTVHPAEEAWAAAISDEP